MVVRLFDPKGEILTIEGSAAKLTVRPFETDDLLGWMLEWEVGQNLNEKATGSRFFTDTDLAYAFGLELPVSIESHSRWIIDRFGGDRASQGKYIGYKDHLNVPCPGTGYDGDPNVSILLDEKIKQSIRTLLE